MSNIKKTTRKNPWPCPICKIGSATREEATTHLKQCSETFHMRELSQFKCGQCVYATHNRRNLVRHMAKHHPKQKEDDSLGSDPGQLVFNEVPDSASDSGSSSSSDDECENNVDENDNVIETVNPSENAKGTGHLETCINTETGDKETGHAESCVENAVCSRKPTDPLPVFAPTRKVVVKKPKTRESSSQVHYYPVRKVTVRTERFMENGRKVKVVETVEEEFCGLKEKD